MGFRAVLDRTSRGRLLWAVLGAFVGMAYLIGASGQVPFSAESIRNTYGTRVLDVVFAYSPVKLILFLLSLALVVLGIASSLSRRWRDRT